MSSSTRYAPPLVGPAVDLDLSRNEGQPPPAELVANSIEDNRLVSSYPDTTLLRRDLAARLGVKEEQVLVTAGADDALFRCLRAFARDGKCAVATTPTFEMVGVYAHQAGTKLESVGWFADGFPTAKYLALAEDADLAIVVSPNNPTGASINRDQLQEVAEAVPLLVLDAAYEEFADDPLTEAALELGNVVVLRTLSKAWGLAGLRVGYAVGPASLIEEISGFGSPFPVSGVSASIAAAVLSCPDEMSAAVGRVRQQRDLLSEMLTNAGATTIPSQANFVLAEFDDASWVVSAARSLGVGLRWFPGRPDLEQSVRVTLPGSEPEFERLLHVFRSALEPEALLFDMDGVLADVSESQTKAIVAAADEFGVTIGQEDIASAKAQGDANDDWELTRRLCADAGVDVAIEEVTRSYESHYQGEGAVGLKAAESLTVDRSQLEEWASQFPIGVVTGRPRADAEEFLDRFDLGELVSTVVTREDAPLKPDPGPVRLALQRLGVSRAWMLGDTPDDVSAATSAGVVPIGVVAPGDDPGLVRRHLAEAAVVLERVEDLRRLLP